MFRRLSAVVVRVHASRLPSKARRGVDAPKAGQLKALPERGVAPSLIPGRSS